MKELNPITQEWEKATPKGIAQSILMDAVRMKLEFLEESNEFHFIKATPAELAAIESQAEKLALRIAKMLQQEL